MAQQADRLGLGCAAELAEGLTPGRALPRRWKPWSRRRCSASAPSGLRRPASAASPRRPCQRHGSPAREGEILAAQPDRRGHVAPAVQRAGQRIGPRGRHDAGGVQRQSLGDQRAEGVDLHQRASRGLGIVAGAHRRQRAEASGAVVFRAGIRPAGRSRFTTAAADERPRVVQPGVLHRCRGAAGYAGIARLAAAGRWRRRP